MSPRILLVDDDPDILESLRDWLLREGYAVDVAGDGGLALARATAEAYDVVVTDLRMPGLDGLALLDGLERLTPRPRVIFLSGQATKADAIAALREGRSFDFFEKPLREMGAMSEAIARALAEPAPAPRPPAGAPDWPDPAALTPPIRAVLAEIRARFAEPLTLLEVARAAGYNAAYLSELVSRETGRSFSHWLTAARLAHARQLLATTAEPISRVAAASGFPDPGYFARAFRQAEGLTPLAWRKARRG